MARKRRPQRINVRISEDLYQKLKRMAETEQEAISVIVRQLLRRSVQNKGEESKT